MVSNGVDKAIRLKEGEVERGRSRIAEKSETRLQYFQIAVIINRLEIRGADQEVSSLRSPGNNTLAVVINTQAFIFRIDFSKIVP
ncbi:hypothetical protein MSLAZ_1332 [Methanosarcina lacustris Z-7289]|uniref:Uncharacterized protein n=1 Tax=Methanosarcina lacustris Z-7289 TaxID=1434111 RepID=A0A0E3S6H1_9EURY|nr:hypothetical protein MSLAZ_1332 [Methanosarcina lacustris Z-7289]